MVYVVLDGGFLPRIAAKILLSKKAYFLPDGKSDQRKLFIGRYKNSFF